MPAKYCQAFAFPGAALFVFGRVRILEFYLGQICAHPILTRPDLSPIRKIFVGVRLPRSTRNNASRAEKLLSDAERYESSGHFRKAFRCLQTAAYLGDAGGQVNLGNFYAWGRGVRRDLAKAAYWYKKTYRSRSGVTALSGVAALNLAIDRRNAGNIRSAVFWFKRAIAMKEGDAFIELAKMYQARRAKRRAAAGLLRRALRLSRDHISDAAKEKAASLLCQIEQIKTS